VWRKSVCPRNAGPSNILDSLAEGASRDDILRSYPTLSPEHIEASLAYAAELAHEESLLSLVGDEAQV
jgi:uncharacterized protein (DUF433 family)